MGEENTRINIRFLESAHSQPQVICDTGNPTYPILLNDHSLLHSPL
jgi:hypothetical protein